MLIERFEENFAVIENDDGSHFNIERGCLPADSREGDILVRDGDKYLIDFDATEKARRKIINLQNSLWK